MANQSIPRDLFLEILSRAPLQTLGRCRLVSRELNNLTYNSYFMHLHSQRTRNISGFFIAYFVSNKYSADFVPKSMENPNNLSVEFLPGRAYILASTNQGLLLCLNATPRRHRIPEYYVCKPSTKEWRQIPNPKTRYFTRKIAMMVLRSDPLRYKIVRLSEPNQFRNTNRKHANEYSLRCEVFDSERWAWHQLEDIYLPYGEILNYRRAISACGGFHWITSKNNILAFNSDDETWTMLSVPDVINEESYHLKLAEYQGKLALLCQERCKDDCFEFWVLEGYFGEKQWIKKHRVCTKPLLNVESYATPEALYNTEIALFSGYDKLLFYKFENGNIIDTVRLKYSHYAYLIFPFQSDLELCNMRIRPRVRDHPHPRPRRSLKRKCKEFIHRLGLFCRRALNPTFSFLFLLMSFIIFCYFLDI